MTASSKLSRGAMTNIGPRCERTSTVPPGGTSRGVPTANRTRPRSIHCMSGWAELVSMMTGTSARGPAFHTVLFSGGSSFGAGRS